jgi:hypothetical protein
MSTLPEFIGAPVSPSDQSGEVRVVDWGVPVPMPKMWRALRRLRPAEMAQAVENFLGAPGIKEEMKNKR